MKTASSLILLFFLVLATSCLSQTTNEFFNRGKAKIKSGDSKGAMIDINKAIELNPNNSEAYYIRGNLKSFSLWDFQSAILDYNKALSIKPTYVDAYYQRGFAKSILKDNQGAFSDFNKAIKLNPNYVDAYNSRGILISKIQ